jgi:DNA-binding transcriptional LysR family regulator
MPRLLIEPELARGELVVACDRPLAGRRNYYFITPEQIDERAPLALFRAWLLARAGGD